MAPTELTIENARILFRNFSGQEGRYNRAGDRNFCLLLDPELAERMASDGWNIKVLQAREEGEDDTPYVQVTVGFKGRPPRVVMLSSRGRTDLDEETVDVLDHVYFDKIDLIIRPYSWEINDKTGVTAYLKSFWATIQEDELDLKYADVEYAK